MIARLRERIGVYSAISEPDALGGQSQNWTFTLALWAGVESIGLTTDSETGRPVRRYRVTTRYRTDLPSELRLSWQGRTYAVRSVDDPDLRRERLHMICEEL